MPTTKENLSDAFAGESQANQNIVLLQKLLKKMDINIAKLFVQLQKQKEFMLKAFKSMDSIGSTLKS